MYYYTNINMNTISYRTIYLLTVLPVLQQQDGDPCHVLDEDTEPNHCNGEDDFCEFGS